MGQTRAWVGCVCSRYMLVGTALTTAAWYWLIQREDAGRLSLFLFLIPVFGVGFAYVFFGERIGAFEAIGTLLIVLSAGPTLWSARSAPSRTAGGTS